ncbi:MAG: amidohydrolase family protein [Dehalococcoidia bacterium]
MSLGQAASVPQTQFDRGSGSKGVHGILVTESYLNLHFSPDTGASKAEHLGYLFGDFSDRDQLASSPDRVIEMMDEIGIRRAQVNVPSMEDLATFRPTLEKNPTRFAVSLRVDPHRGRPLLKEIESVQRDLRSLLTSVSMVPFTYQPRTPPNHARYYSLYTKCADLGLPVNINVGIPGPRQPGEVQNPIYLDEVCYDFPDLTIVMRHGGDPWADVCAKLLLKWPNLYYCTDAWAPSHYRPEILDFANRRNPNKVMYGGYFPALSYERLFSELEQLPLRDHVWEPFLSGNATRVYGL